MGGGNVSQDQTSIICIDLKSFYASVECVERGLNPFKTNLVVADPTRSKSTICLAITPAMKALGIKNRCRIHEIPESEESRCVRTGLLLKVMCSTACLMIPNRPIRNGIYRKQY